MAEKKTLNYQLLRFLLQDTEPCSRGLEVKGHQRGQGGVKVGVVGVCVSLRRSR